MKTINLTGATLDWAVDKSLNLNTPYNSWGQAGKVPLYSTDWSQGGPIIERHRIEICHLDNGEWRAQLNANQWGFHCRHYGESPLIAAMRCYVASKQGNDVEIPEALCNQ